VVAIDGESGQPHRILNSTRKLLLERLFESNDLPSVIRLMENDPEISEFFFERAPLLLCTQVLFSNEFGVNSRTKRIDEIYAKRIQGQIGILRSRPIRAIQGFQDGRLDPVWDANLMPHQFRSAEEVSRLSERERMSIEHVADLLAARGEYYAALDPLTMTLRPATEADYEATHPLKNWLSETRGLADYEKENLVRDPWPELPRTAVALNELFFTAPLYFARRESIFVFPWARILPALSQSQLRWACRRFRHDRGGDLLFNEIEQRLDSLSLDANDAVLLILDRLKYTSGSSENSKRTRGLLLKVLTKHPSIEQSLKVIEELRPYHFPTGLEYVETVNDLVGAVIAPSLNDQTPEKRGPVLKRLREIVDKVTAEDTALGARVLEAVSETLEARPTEQEVLRMRGADVTKPVQKYAESFNAILSAFSKLDVSQKWDLIQWIRGKNPSIDAQVAILVSEALQSRLVYVPGYRLAEYLRARFDEMSPLIRAGLILALLTDKSDLLSHQAWRIESEIFKGLEGGTEETAREIYLATRAALPKPLENLLIALAFSESGKHGSPEQALRLILSRFGVLFNKLGGQSLAFEQRLPESFRKELEKIWDEVEPYSWWEVQDLLHGQYGDIEAAGYRLVKIRNSGTTEITVELEGPNQQRVVTSVQRRALKTSGERDFEDLQNIHERLTADERSTKYGFLRMHIRDAHQTLQMEIDRNHKREVAEPMLSAYRGAIARLGGRGMQFRRWNFVGETYHDISLPEGKTLVTRDIALGVPLKSLKSSDPSLYRKLSGVILKLETEAQNDPNGMVDKDRMPGQYFVDVNTRTVTLLDHGQAKRVPTERLRDRDQFIAATLDGDSETALSILANLGIDTEKIDRSKLESDLKETPIENRPMVAIQSVEDMLQYKIDQEHQILVAKRMRSRSQRNHRSFGDFEDQVYVTDPFDSPEPIPAKPKVEFSPEYDDFIHAFRAQLRLAHWAESVGSPVIRDRWRGLVIERKTGPVLAKAAVRCDSVLRSVGAWFRGRNKVPMPEMNPVQN
jgi:hypothetical protein